MTLECGVYRNGAFWFELFDTFMIFKMEEMFTLVQSLNWLKFMN